ncbi:MAG: SGNH/GDSL hydrolase family protein [Opitutales bacterium]
MIYIKLAIYLWMALLSLGLKAAEPGELYTGPEYQKAFHNPEDTDLPNVLLIGDSISIGYTIEVRKLLRGQADVFRIPTNGRYAAFGTKRLKKWLGDREWDVIHFNWGLWDLCYRNPESENQGSRDKVNGQLTATLDQYRKSLEDNVERLQATGAHLIWCETTPVPEGEAGRFTGDALKYNAIAAEVMKAAGVSTNLLHEHASLRIPEIQKAEGDVHFTPEGYAYLAEKVAETIATVLEN